MIATDLAQPCMLYSYKEKKVPNPLKIAADTLAGKIPYTSKSIPLLGKGIQAGGKWTAKGIQETAKFLGKQVFTRAALGAQDVFVKKFGRHKGTTTFNKEIPEFKELSLIHI